MKSCIDGYVYDTDFAKLVLAAPEKRWGGEFSIFREQQMLYKAPNGQFFIITKCLERDGCFFWGKWNTNEARLSLVSIDMAAAFVKEHGTHLEYCAFITFCNVGGVEAEARPQPITTPLRHEDTAQ